MAEALHTAPIGSVNTTVTAADSADLWQIRVQDCDLTIRVIAHTKPSDAYSVELDDVCR